MNKLTVLLTGSSGFVGHHVLLKLLEHDYKVILISRRRIKNLGSSSLEQFIIPSLEEFFDWNTVLADVDYVIHCAAVSHSYNNEPRFKKKIWEVNHTVTMRIVEAALRNHVKRFVFLSTVKVYGENSKPGQTFNESSATAPADTYASSKLAAERDIISLCSNSKLKFVIIRSPVVYGPGVKGNVQFLQKLIKYRFVFPRRVLNKNLRSIVSIQNLSEFILFCLQNPNAANQVLLIKDQSDKSTEGFIKHLASEMDIKAVFVPLPIWSIYYLLKILGRERSYKALVNNLVIDNTKTLEKMKFFSA